MDNNQIVEMMKQYAQQGKDASALYSDYQTLAASGKTPLGLNQWIKSDKPRMEDFNEDNSIIDKKLRELAAEKASVSTQEFTPALVGATVPGSYSYSLQKGIVQIIGKMAFVNISLSYSTIAAGTGNLSITGLPAAPTGQGMYYTGTIFHTTKMSNIANGSIVPRIGSGGRAISLMVTRSSDTFAWMSANDIAAGGVIDLSISYPIA